MDRVSIQIVRIVTFLILSVVFIYLIIISDAEFLMRNSYILLLLLSFIVIIVIEGIWLIAKKKLNKSKKIYYFLEYSVLIILGIFIFSSLFQFNKEIIDDNNANEYIDNTLNMDDFHISANEIICTDGTAYKTMFTNKWYSYLTGFPLNKESDISGMRVEYIDFHKDYISDFLLNKYYKQMTDTYEFEKKDGIMYCEEKLFKEKQIYVLYKSNNKIIFVKMFLKEKTDTDEFIKIISNKLNCISD